MRVAAPAKAVKNFYFSKSKAVIVIESFHFCLFFYRMRCMCLSSTKLISDSSYVIYIHDGTSLIK